MTSLQQFFDTVIDDVDLRPKYKGQGLTNKDAYDRLKDLDPNTPYNEVLLMAAGLKKFVQGYLRVTGGFSNFSGKPSMPQLMDAFQLQVRAVQAGSQQNSPPRRNASPAATPVRRSLRVLGLSPGSDVSSVASPAFDDPPSVASPTFSAPPSSPAARRRSSRRIAEKEMPAVLNPGSDSEESGREDGDEDATRSVEQETASDAQSYDHTPYRTMEALKNTPIDPNHLIDAAKKDLQGRTYGYILGVLKNGNFDPKNQKWLSLKGAQYLAVAYMEALMGHEIKSWMANTKKGAQFVALKMAMETGEVKPEWFEHPDRVRSVAPPPPPTTVGGGGENASHRSFHFDRDDDDTQSTSSFDAAVTQQNALNSAGLGGGGGGSLASAQEPPQISFDKPRMTRPEEKKSESWREYFGFSPTPPKTTTTNKKKKKKKTPAPTSSSSSSSWWISKYIPDFKTAKTYVANEYEKMRLHFEGEDAEVDLTEELVKEIVDANTNEKQQNVLQKLWSRAKKLGTKAASKIPGMARTIPSPDSWDKFYEDNVLRPLPVAASAAPRAAVRFAAHANLGLPFGSLKSPVAYGAVDYSRPWRNQLAVNVQGVIDPHPENLSWKAQVALSRAYLAHVRKVERARVDADSHARSEAEAKETRDFAKKMAREQREKRRAMNDWADNDVPAPPEEHMKWIRFDIDEERERRAAAY